MKFASLEFPKPSRSEIRAILHATKPEGMPDSAVNEITDIALHAAEQARTKLLEVIDTASSPGISTPAFSIAVSLLAADCEGLKAAIHEIGQASGRLFTVKVAAER